MLSLFLLVEEASSWVSTYIKETDPQVDHWGRSWRGALHVLKQIGPVRLPKCQFAGKLLCKSGQLTYEAHQHDFG